MSSINPLYLARDTSRQIKDAVKADQGRAIYEHYGFTPSKKAQKTNPFREERTCSLHIYPAGNFYDFGDPDIKGDALAFIQRLNNCDFPEALKIAGGIYGITEAVPSSKYTPPLKRNNSKTGYKPEAKKELISISFREPSSKELDYWKAKAGVGPGDLERAKFRAVDSFTVRTKKKVDQQGVFALEIVPGETYKLIQLWPHLYGYGPGKTSYLPNLDAAKAKNPDYTFSWGIDTLRTGEPVYLVEGEKDFLAMRAAGYNCFTLGSAVPEIKPYILSQLEARSIELSNIIVLYDTDETGLKTSEKLCEKYGIKRVVLPKLPTGAEAKKQGINDICDYFKLYGFDDDFRDALASPTGPGIDREYHLKLGEYLGDLGAGFRSEFSQAKRILLEAGTGTGKTTIALEIAENWEGFTIIVEPLNDICEQKGRDCNVPYLTSETYRDTFLHKIGKNTKAVFCNYDMLPQLIKDLSDYLGISQYNLILDEQHELVNAMGYRAGKATQVGDALAGAVRVLAMSATPFKTGLDNWQKIRVNDTRPKLEPEIIRTANRIPTAIEAISRSKTQKIVFINSKEKLKQFADALRKRGYKVAEIYEHDKLKGDRTYRALIDTGKLPEGIDILLCTSKIATGIDIHVCRDCELIYIENRPGFNGYQARQFEARVRNRERVKGFTIIAGENSHKGQKTDITGYYRDLLERWEKTADIWAGKSLEDTLTIKRNGHTEALNYLLPEPGGTLRVNELAIQYDALQKEISESRPEDFYKVKAGAIHVSSKTKALVKEAKEARKAENKANEKDIISQLNDNTKRDGLITAVQANTQDASLWKWLKPEFNTQGIPLSDGELETATKILKLVKSFDYLDVGFGDALVLITKEGELKSNKEIADRREALAIHYNLEMYSPDQLEPRSKMDYQFMEAFRGKLAGELTGREIYQRYREAYRATYGHEPEAKQTKAVQLAGILFNLESKKVRKREGGNYRVYTIGDPKTLAGICGEFGIRVPTFKTNISIKESNFKTGYREYPADFCLAMMPVEDCPF